MRSPFRPSKPPDPDILDNHRDRIRLLQRRGIIRGGLSLGALALLTGCDVTSDPSIDKGLRQISKWNDRVQAALFDPNHLAPTYPASMILRPPKFNAYYDITEVKPVAVADWKLELAGLVTDKRPWTLERLMTLPSSSMVIKHICVEGWDYIGGWSGPTLRSFLERVGADLHAKYVAFKTADDYPSSIDMATALHPQTQLTFWFDGDVLPRQYGFPMKLRIPTKLGFKNPKHIGEIEIGNEYTGGYWETYGYNWFSGL
jgi:DMSO/TMAO reductase YedYZ molybdopterin-dependent catalytic subunit